MARKGYIFTDKRESRKGILSTLLGAISLVSLAAAVYFSFRERGETLLRYGVVGLLCLLYAAVGLVLGILAKIEQDRFHLFAWLGIGLNCLALAEISFILYAGAYGL